MSGTANFQTQPAFRTGVERNCSAQVGRTRPDVKELRNGHRVTIENKSSSPFANTDTNVICSPPERGRKYARQTEQHFGKFVWKSRFVAWEINFHRMSRGYATVKQKKRTITCFS